MKSIRASRLVDSQPLLPRLIKMAAASKNGRLLSTSSNKGDETLGDKSPSMEKILVFGGNGFVGSHICREALERGLTVHSLSRSGRPSYQDSWTNSIVWHQGDLLSPDSLKSALTGVTSVISCVGGFGSNSHMYKINGTANINAVIAATELGVKKFVYISAADFGLVNYLLRGYYEGKRATEAELMKKLPHGGVILRPGFIHGTRRVGQMKLPLSIIGAPLEMILKHAKLLSKIPLIGPLFIPPVHVTSVAKVAVTAATDPPFPPGIIDIYGILQLAHQKSA
ncbi:uncharacterized protein At1g32220, chloroplastic-like [Mangifera indica]|uniref:uncharacterized protein At1g32220, chloroplastic-like n=1 Tax=Mangifera indica TaxID=29780 RepID=UPI001CFAC8B0|nr:uncharacterized protein At1g32220, chloroplastic-like [Mangifera indica]